MAAAPKFKMDLANLADKVASQFRGLNPNDPSVWPLLPKSTLCLAVGAFVLVALWFVWLSASQEELDDVRAQEVRLKDEYKKKLGQAINLDVLKKQREQVLQYVNQLEKQLPGKAEMDALLSDITQAGVGRSLQFDLFRPGSVSVKEYYAELPISLRLTGKYSDLGAFAGDIAQLSRIVTLNNLTLSPARDGVLTMDTTAKTFRYLDPDEVAAQRSQTSKAGKK
jgi:type IV pilus assembly protein PilO